MRADGGVTPRVMSPIGMAADRRDTGPLVGIALRLVYLVFMASLPCLQHIASASDSGAAEAIRDYLEFHVATFDSMRDYTTVVRYHVIAYPEVRSAYEEETHFREERIGLLRVSHIPGERAMLYHQEGTQTREGGPFQGWNISINDNYLIKDATCTKLWTTARLANITDGSESIVDAIIGGVQAQGDPRHEVTSLIKDLLGFIEVMGGPGSDNVLWEEVSSGDGGRPLVRALLIIPDDDDMQERRVAVTFDSGMDYLPVSFEAVGDDARYTFEYGEYAHGSGSVWLPRVVRFEAEEADPGFRYKVFEEYVFEMIEMDSGLHPDDLTLEIPHGTRVVDATRGNIEYIAGATDMVDTRVDQLLRDTFVEFADEITEVEPRVAPEITEAPPAGSADEAAAAPASNALYYYIAICTVVLVLAAMLWWRIWAHTKAKRQA